MKKSLSGFATGALIGTLGGLIGLGGAEFRLPLLIGLFRFAALDAVIINKATSLVVVATALPFRTVTVPFKEVLAQGPTLLNLLAGSLVGAWIGAGWALRLRTASFYRIIAILLLLIGSVLFFAHDLSTSEPLLTGLSQQIAGVVAGFGIGIVSSLLGVAGGELLIPTLVLLFGADIKLAGSLSLAVSLPTMLVAFARYSRDDSFAVLGRNLRFVLVMAAGSVLGTFIGGRLGGLKMGRAAGAEGGRHLDQLAVDFHDASDGGEKDREQRGAEDDEDFLGFAKSEQQDEYWVKRQRRSLPEELQYRVQCLLNRAVLTHEEAQRDAEADRCREGEARALQADCDVVEQRPADDPGPSGGQDFVQRREDGRVQPAERRSDLPDRKKDKQQAIAAQR